MVFGEFQLMLKLTDCVGYGPITSEQLLDAALTVTDTPTTGHDVGGKGGCVYSVDVDSASPSNCRTSLPASHAPPDEVPVKEDV